MTKCLSIITALCFTCSLQAQVTAYDLSSVPEIVKKDADVIKRYEDIVLEVTDIDRASYTVHKIVTIKNENGKSELAFSVPTNKTVLLDDASITVYDVLGRPINRYKKKDMQTVATGEGLIEDGSLTGMYVPAAAYPVTVEYKFTLRFKGTLFFPPYQIIRPGQGVERSSFTAKVPKELGLRYKEKNIKLAPQITEEGAYRLYKWTANNLAPIANEAGAVSAESRYPSILLAPNRFSYYGHTGDLTSWQSFGEWINKLYTGLDELPEERKAFFRNLVKDAPNDREKVRLIYDYLQKNFRYVSIQLGIGGLKPFSADVTDKKKYGDCKGLSNYMKAALKAVNITSHVAIINAGYNSEPVDRDFPANMFDHAILCVPQPQDSIWLECTSSKADFDILGSFTENRNALLVTDAGGVLVKTPASTSAGNKLITTTSIDLANDGSGKTATLFRSNGRYKGLLDFILNEKKDDQKASIVNSLGFKQPDAFDYNKKDTGDLFTTALTMTVEKIPEFTAGNKMFLAPRLHKIWDITLPKADKRKLDYYFQSPFAFTDTTIFKLPAGATVEALPKPVSLTCSYASYSTAYWYNEAEKAVYAAASLVLNQYKIPAADYAAVKKLFDDVQVDAGQRIVVKTE
ncbi:DUF3857 domain-containing protein [Longitalea luteola]|uniref:DUF3857 domain-containing protein n=1 Tax=Longitalea luteola TaxID=2812563 RepID=UPI001A958227|nr:DUF3857 domain-containing protein [Longitalea luteola]